MSEELVRRLRGWPAVIKAESVMLEAADRIEELEAKLAKAAEMALEECPYREDTRGYRDWWSDRRSALAAMQGDKT